jgi:hypothetical protein
MVVGAMVVGLTCLSITALLLIRDKDEEHETIPYLRDRVLSVRILCATLVAAILGGYILKYAVSFYVSKTVVLNLSDDNGAQIQAPLLPKLDEVPEPPPVTGPTPAYVEPAMAVPPCNACPKGSGAATHLDGTEQIARNLIDMFEVETPAAADLVSLP